MVYTLASQLITSCPDSNAVSPSRRARPESGSHADREQMLPVMAYPPITVMMSPLTGNAPTGTNVTLSFKGSANMTGTMYAAIYSTWKPLHSHAPCLMFPPTDGLATQVLPLENMTFKLPPVQGYSYVVVTTQSDQSMVSGEFCP